MVFNSPQSDQVESGIESWNLEDLVFSHGTEKNLVWWPKAGDGAKMSDGIENFNNLKSFK
jgi:hypothetical protein